VLHRVRCGIDYHHSGVKTAGEDVSQITDYRSARNVGVFAIGAEGNPIEPRITTHPECSCDRIRRDDRIAVGREYRNRIAIPLARPPTRTAAITVLAE
jgi:hypothetical protein